MRQKNKICVFMILFFCESSYSADLYGHVTGSSSIIWDNAVPISNLGGITTSYWSIKEPYTTSEWYPGGLSNPVNQQVVFTNTETGDSFITNVNWKGVQYSLGNSSSKFRPITLSMVGSGVADVCSNAVVSPNLATISHSNGKCVSNEGYVSSDGRRYSPFKFFRTIIDIPNFVRDIQGSNSGRYSAVLESTPIYFYKSETGVITYLQHYEPIVIQIDYTAAFFTDAKIVLGNGNIEPVYNKVNQTISGSTVYRVKVDGMFPDGIKMSFDTSKKYELISNSNSNVTIPYNISCQNGCASSGLLVKEGNFESVRFPLGQVISDARSASETSVFLDFEISYSQLGEQLVSSLYSDQFSVIFEVNL
ncbi:hypothetical protein [Vibrio parahaemolyticus]|uniref:hypothetical protein n=1 Tax=Vibrio parahaemolyticus TaxID=670 RepID=UPI000495CB06|nr:hypothetical protein [Vibrio parahaemolyticus]MBE3897546.1 hypothetical protein [Vibrio parahaemolyticus]